MEGKLSGSSDIRISRESIKVMSAVRTSAHLNVQERGWPDL